jgi:hypothetical protein
VVADAVVMARQVVGAAAVAVVVASRVTMTTTTATTTTTVVVADAVVMARQVVGAAVVMARHCRTVPEWGSDEGWQRIIRQRWMPASSTALTNRLRVALPSCRVDG